MSKRHEVNVGDLFGNLEIIEEVPHHIYPSGGKRRKFNTRCVCGKEGTFLINTLLIGKTTSCGCLYQSPNQTHGMHNTRQYQCWADMKTRCDNTSNKFYSYYGGRGITYCEKWKTFEGFWEDMSDGYSDDLTLNRRDNDGMYCKENCEWDTKNFQGHMRRKQRDTQLSIIGATLDKNGKTYSVRMRINTDPVYLGKYETTEEAAEAYDAASEIVYGDRPNKTVTTRNEIRIKIDYYIKHKDTILSAKGERNASAILTSEKVLEIVQLYKDGTPQKDIAKIYNINQSTVSGICRGSAWAHITNIIHKPRKNK